MSEKNEFVSSSGSQFYQPIDYEYDEKAKCMVPKYGKKINRYEVIQASKPACDINYIVKRALAGDMSALNVRVPNYADVSEMPDNLNDLNDLQKNSIKQFDNLNPDIKSLFNNDVDVFLTCLEDGSYLTKINEFVESKNKVNENANESEGDK